MKKSNYVLYRAIKRAAATAEELYDSYAEALEFTIETGYGLLSVGGSTGLMMAANAIV